MARPLKKGLRYFPLDSDLLEDRKVKRLLRRYSSEGIAIYISVLCDIYRMNGYYASFDDDYCEDVGFTLNLSEKRVREIIAYCCELGLFDEGLWVNKQVLTSVEIQEHYREICKRSRNCISEELLLLLKKDESKIKSEVSVAETSFFASETSLKEKENKRENKEKETESSSSSLPPPSSFDSDAFLSKVAECFNTTFHDKLPSLTELTPKRAEAVLSRVKQFDRDAVFRMLGKVEESPFLLGENERGWRADFDWLFCPENFLKVIEGKYDQLTTKESTHGKDDGSSRCSSAAEREAELQRLAAEAIRRDLDQGTVR